MHQIQSRQLSRSSSHLSGTNNSAEAYHRRINSIFQCAHPTLWFFLQKLIDEENVVHADMVQIDAGEPPKKKKLNERLEKHLLNLLRSPTPTSLYKLIRSHTISSCNYFSSWLNKTWKTQSNLYSPCYVNWETCSYNSRSTFLSLIIPVLNFPCSSFRALFSCAHLSPFQIWGWGCGGEKELP